MGRDTFSRAAFAGAHKAFTTPGESATKRGEQAVQKTGKLNPLVDPAEYGVIRESRMRLEEKPNGRFKVAVGAPVPIEYRLDTTGSMGDNVERAIKVLPDICGLVSAVLPERDPFYCASIFGDVVDQFPLCRGQFEVLAERMVDQLTLMHPEGAGGDSPEDPHYGFFGAAYLTKAYLQAIGLRSYDFTITDAPAHDRLSVDQLARIFGGSVFDKLAENGHQINKDDLPTNRELVKDLLKRAHAFCLLVVDRDNSSVLTYWHGLYGKDRVVILPRIEYVPHVMATIIGLTEGTLDLRSAKDFVKGHNLEEPDARRVIDAVAHIPLGAQCALPNFPRIPKKGDIFVRKTDLWPVGVDDSLNGDAAPSEPSGSPPGDPGGWL